MRAISRRTMLLAASLFAMTACGAAGGDDTGSVDASASHEMSMGAEDAPVTVIEYASWTCSHCLQFRNDVLTKMETDYVDTGKVKFIFREFPTAPANITIAGFAVARCAGEDKYFDVINELFDRQAAFLSLAREGGQIKVALQQVAANHGITDPASFDACLQDSGIRKAIAASVAQGDAAGVTGTPTILINGKLPEGYQWRTWEGMQAILNEALGEDAPAAPEPEDASAPDEAAEPEDAATPGDSEPESGDADIVEPTSGEAEPE